MILIGVGGLDVTGQPGDAIKTLALGSCVALVIYHLPTRVLGMAHVALPDSNISPDKSQLRPGYFADTAIKELLRRVSTQAGDRTISNYLVKLAGGAKVMDPKGTFNIGLRNAEAIKNELSRRRLKVAAEDLGGVISRNVTALVDNGDVLVASSGRGQWCL
jgi:chemotaxis protein CheD